MTKDEIIKALDYCIKDDLGYDNFCIKCPFRSKESCTEVLRKKSLNLINQQSAEIEQLKSTITELRQNSVGGDIYEELLNEHKKLKREMLKCRMIMQSNADLCVICGADVSDLSTQVCDRCRKVIDEGINDDL